MSHIRTPSQKKSGRSDPAAGQRHMLVLAALVIWAGLLAAGCSPPQVTQAQTTAQIEVDGEIVEVVLEGGSTVQNALDQAEIELSPLDRVEPRR